MARETHAEPTHFAPMRIGGRDLPAMSGRALEVHDPSTGELLATVADGDSQDVDAAVAAALRSSSEWAQTSPSSRARILWKIADLIEANIDSLAEMEARNAGLVVPLAKGFISYAAETFRYYSGWCTKIHGITATLRPSETTFHCYTVREPIGVCGFILPWNIPIMAMCLKVAPALAAGCTCVVKPAEETPLTALRIADLMRDAGIPEGVVNVVTGRGESAGAALVAHNDVAKIGFTGSTEVGKAIVKGAAGNLKKVTLELGGKSPVVIFADADLESAIQGAALGVFTHAGQLCLAGSRVYVERPVYERVLAGLAAAADSLAIGGALETSTQVGPIISAVQLSRIRELIDNAPGEGARLVTGGTSVDRDGYFIRPTVFADTPPNARISREEIFGPVVNVYPFDDLEEMLAAANDTDYGLTAAVWTKSLSKAHTVAGRLAAGIVWINCQFVADPSLPLGGYKQSGWGREGGWEGLEPYLQTKAVIAQVGAS